MPVRIRFARHGKKAYPFYHIVVADSRAPRDGKFIERIGSYNPNTNPATIELDFDRALTWLQNGAQPSDTARAVLSYKGVLMKKHLLEGVKKGAFSAEEAEARFEKVMNEKNGKIEAKKTSLKKAKDEAAKQKLAEESKVKEAIAKKVSEKLAAKAEAEAEAETAAEEASTEEAPAEEDAPEAAPAEESAAE